MTGGSSFSAIANDYGFDQVYARQVSGMLQPGDVLVGYSTSGNSANVIEADTRCTPDGRKNDRF